MSIQLDVSAGPRIIAGRYVLGELLGRGAMGRVFRARDRLLDRDVAVKLLYDDAVGDGGMSRTCSAEAQAAGRLCHDGIARVFDAGVDEGCLFIVMELVEGETLANRLAGGARPRMREAVALAAQVADALDHAHACGVVHCDVKPANILVTPEGRTKLVDFGIAHAATVTGTLALGELRGSAPYISPEQVRGDAVDGRSDVYALGAVLFELLAGRPPFEGTSVAAVMAQRLVSDPPSLRTLNRAVPSSLDRVVRRALARDPVQRYLTAADLAAELWSVLPALPERDEPPPSVAARVGRLGNAAGAWAGCQMAAASSALDRAGSAWHGRASRRRQASRSPRRAIRSSGVHRAGAPSQAVRQRATLGDWLGGWAVAASGALDRAGAELHARPPRARLAAGGAATRKRVEAVAAVTAAWLAVAVAALARAGAGVRSASVRAGLAARTAILVSLATLAQWAARGGRQARRLGPADGTWTGVGLTGSLAAGSRGLDRVGAALRAGPPRPRVGGGPARLVMCARGVGARTAGWLVAAADAVDRAEPVARSAWARMQLAAGRQAATRSEELEWTPMDGRASFRPAFGGPPARRDGVVEEASSTDRLGAGRTLEELEAELASAFPDLDGRVDPADPGQQRDDWSEVPTLTRSRRR